MSDYVQCGKHWLQLSCSHMLSGTLACLCMFAYMLQSLTGAMDMHVAKNRSGTQVALKRGPQQLVLPVSACIYQPSDILHSAIMHLQPSLRRTLCQSVIVYSIAKVLHCTRCSAGARTLRQFTFSRQSGKAGWPCMPGMQFGKQRGG